MNRIKKILTKCKNEHKIMINIMIKHDNTKLEFLEFWFKNLCFFLHVIFLGKELMVKNGTQISEYSSSLVFFLFVNINF